MSFFFTAFLVLVASPPQHSVEVLAETIRQQPAERQIELLEELIDDHDRPEELTEVIRYLHRLRELELGTEAEPQEQDQRLADLDLDYVESMGDSFASRTHPPERLFEPKAPAPQLWLTDVRGQQIQIDALKIGDRQALAGDLCVLGECGPSHIEVPLNRIERLVVLPGSDELIVEVWTGTYEPQQLRLARNTMVRAESSFGSVRLSLDEVEEIALRAE